MNKLQYNTTSYSGTFAMFSVLIGYLGAFIILFSIFKWIYMPPDIIGMFLCGLIFLTHNF